MVGELKSFAVLFQQKLKIAERNRIISKNPGNQRGGKGGVGLVIPSKEPIYEK